MVEQGLKPRPSRYSTSTQKKYWSLYFTNSSSTLGTVDDAHAVRTQIINHVKKTTITKNCEQNDAIILIAGFRGEINGSQHCWKSRPFTFVYVVLHNLIYFYFSGVWVWEISKARASWAELRHCCRVDRDGQKLDNRESDSSSCFSRKRKGQSHI